MDRRSLQQPVRLAGQLVALAFLLRRSTAARRAAARRRAPAARRPPPSRRTAAGAQAGTRRWRRHRAAPPGAVLVGIVARQRRPLARPEQPKRRVRPPSRSLRCCPPQPRPPRGRRPPLASPRESTHPACAAAPRRRLVHADDVRRHRCTGSRSAPRPACRASSASIASVGPTRRTPDARWRAAATAPSTMGPGRMVAAHRVDGDQQARRDALALDTRNGGADPPTGRLGLVDRPDLPAAVVPAVGAHLVGALGSWHCGHSPSWTGASASCVRRLAVRVFEWRRFGLGIVVSFNERFQARQAGIFPRGSHAQVVVFRFAPHTGHRPWQSSRHSGFIGSIR